MTFIDYFIFILVITIFSSTLFFVDEPWFLIGLGLFLLIKLSFEKRKNFNQLLIVLFIWILINLTSFALNNSGFSFSTFIGYSIRICISFFLISLWGKNLWIILEKIIFVLVSISLFIFLLNLLFPDFFSELSFLFQPFIDEVYLRKDSQSHYWNNFFYTYTGRNDGRNSGFMWEPGSFALIIVLFVIVNWINNGIHFNKRILIYFIGIFSTLSTAGYFALFFLMLALFLNKKGGFIYLIIISIIIGLNVSLLYQDFLIPKVNDFLTEAENDVYYEQGFTERLEANRIAYFGINFSKNLIYPFGHGVVEDQSSFKQVIKIVGVGGLSDILYKWGFLGLLIFLIVCWNFVNRINFSIYSKLLIFLSLFIVLFSNPIESNLIAFLLFFTNKSYI